MKKQAQDFGEYSLWEKKPWQNKWNKKASPYSYIYVGSFLVLSYLVRATCLRKLNTFHKKVLKYALTQQWIHRVSTIKKDQQRQQQKNRLC